MEDFALFGGSFNPIHKGHLNIIKYVLDHADIDKVIVIPAFISPFKAENEGASSTDRLNMIHLSINDFFKDTPYINRIEVNTYELSKGTVSYTSETIRYVKEHYNIVGRVRFIIGSDLIQNLDAWHDRAYIRDNVHFILLSRDSSNNYSKKLSSLIQNGYEIIQYSNPLFEASSTDVRDGIGDEVTESVKSYIKTHNLYQKSLKK